MNRQLTEQDGRDALHQHLVAKASEARLKYGLYIDADVIEKMLDDRDVVRYPTGLRYDAQDLEPGEFAYAHPLSEESTGGYCLFIHPWFEPQREILPLLVAYHIPVINYGSEIVTHEEAELFGATLLGIEVDSYYQALCELADSIPQ